MRHRITYISLFLFLMISCTKNVDFSQDFKNETSGRYLYTADEVMEVYYDNDKLFLKWRGAERIKPVVLDQHTIFVADMYKKLRFVQHPDTGVYYLSIVNPENEQEISYDYMKLSDEFRLPSEHLKEGNFEKAVEGYLKIQEQDPESYIIEEYEFNRLGYDYLREKNYERAIDVFKLNVALYPESSNVYDSLADAYKRSGDSLKAYENYKKSLEINSENPRAKKFIEAYNDASL